ncbi:LigA protein [Kutzneria sp. 744]|nr:LigA protein [Kutzneria sp. 744]
MLTRGLNQMNPRLRVTAIVNPAAGGDGAKAVAALAAVGTATLDTVETTAAGDATDLAFKLAVGENPPDVITGVGGDGTICEVVTGLHRAREAGAAVPPLLVAPAGTGNSTYRGLWDDAPWETVAATALRGEAVVRHLDLARVEQTGHVVVLGSGSGLFAESLLARLGRPETGRELLIAASLAAMQSHVPYAGRVTVDGEVIYEGGIVETIAGGFPYRGGVLHLVPESIVDDGLLDITVIPASVELMDFGQAAVGRTLYQLPGVCWGRGERITVERLDGQPVLYEHDGEVMPATGPAYDLTALPAALAVLTPAEAPTWFGRR